MNDEQATFLGEKLDEIRDGLDVLSHTIDESLNCVGDEQANLRDRFAMAVVVGAGPINGHPIGRPWTPAELATWSYSVADAMLAARKPNG